MAFSLSDQANLKLRIISAVALIPLTLFVVYSGGWIYAAFIMIGGAIALYEWIQLSKKTAQPLLLSIGGAIYLSAAAISFYKLGTPSWLPALMMFLIAWSSDITAYVMGKFIGGPKLLPAISPKKTWAGFAGALLGPGILLAVMMPMIIGIQDYISPATFYFAVAGMALGAVCQIGDLMISGLKRLAATKDSGALIPGHGGLLDRIDSLLLLSIVMMPLLLWLSPHG